MVVIGRKTWWLLPRNHNRLGRVVILTHWSLPGLGTSPASFFCLIKSENPFLRGNLKASSVFHKPSRQIFIGGPMEGTRNHLFVWFSRKQECIPVRCVLTAAVATTRCQNWGDVSTGGVPTSGDIPTTGGVCILEECLLLGVSVYCGVYLLGIRYKRWHHTLPHGQNDRRL